MNWRRSEKRKEWNYTEGGKRYVERGWSGKVSIECYEVSRGKRGERWANKKCNSWFDQLGTNFKTCERVREGDDNLTWITWFSCWSNPATGGGLETILCMFGSSESCWILKHCLLCFESCLSFYPLYSILLVTRSWNGTNWKERFSWLVG